MRSSALKTDSDPIALPRVNEVPPVTVALTAVARQLAATYSEVVCESIPEPLESIAASLRIEERSPTYQDSNKSAGHTPHQRFENANHALSVSLGIVIAFGIGCALA